MFWINVSLCFYFTSLKIVDYATDLYNVLKYKATFVIIKYTIFAFF